jgi:hypothetical protein
MGWFSSIKPDGMSYSRRWHLTKEGLVALEHWMQQAEPKQ